MSHSHSVRVTIEKNIAHEIELLHIILNYCTDVLHIWKINLKCLHSKSRETAISKQITTVESNNFEKSWALPSKHWALIILVSVAR